MEGYRTHQSPYFLADTLGLVGEAGGADGGMVTSASGGSAMTNTVKGLEQEVIS